jgi:hypothetical protein
LQISTAVVLTLLGLPGSREPCGAASIRLTAIFFETNRAKELPIILKRR